MRRQHVSPLLQALVLAATLQLVVRPAEASIAPAGQRTAELGPASSAETLRGEHPAPSAVSSSPSEDTPWLAWVCGAELAAAQQRPLLARPDRPSLACSLRRCGLIIRAPPRG